MNIFEAVCTALREDGCARLGTIIGITGSAPAPSQSRLLLRLSDETRIIGTVGGGCLDESVRWCLTEDPHMNRTRLRSFELNDELGDTGLTCGGTVHVLLEALGQTTLPLYEAIVAHLTAGESAYLVTVLHNDGSAWKVLLDSDGAPLSGSPPAEIPSVALIHATVTGSPQRLQVGGETFVIEPLFPDPPLIIFGGGHVGKVVSECAAFAGFEVTLVDDREAYANPERFPEAKRIVCEEFETALQKLRIAASSYVVIVTRGHKHDEFILEQVLRHDSKYVGMIGSKRKVLLTLRHLQERGTSPEKLAAVHAPIGLEIGALTAAEIGVSIVAEIISVRRNAPRPASVWRAEKQIRAGAG